LERGQVEEGHYRKPTWKGMGKYRLGREGGENEDSEDFFPDPGNADL